MKIFIIDSSGVAYLPHPKCPNLFVDIAAGTRLTGVVVDGATDAINVIADGDEILVGLSAIRRARAQKRAA
ncbi:MAG TPA: hypothetical protein PKV98_04140 [Burkholderiaceae bacterium]|nr:hypothetical protein [Burkholderiaceae bacterium]